MQVNNLCDVEKSPSSEELPIYARLARPLKERLDMVNGRRMTMREAVSAAAFLYVRMNSVDRLRLHEAFEDWLSHGAPPEHLVPSAGESEGSPAAGRSSAGKSSTPVAPAASPTRTKAKRTG